MVWDKIKRMLGRSGDGSRQPVRSSQPQPSRQAEPLPGIKWIEAADNPWGVRVLDVRPVTLTMLSTSSDPQAAANAVSYSGDDGTGFIGAMPPSRRTIEASLRYPIDRMCAEGVLFIPDQMEHKWAIFQHRGLIIFVRSWTRTVLVTARIEHRGAHVEITRVDGTFVNEDESPDYTIRVLDYLLRSHALGLPYPAPLPMGVESDPDAAALWCMNVFGNRALVATPYRLQRSDPDRPLRTHSLLHIAVARGRVPDIDACLQAGIPVDLLAADGLAPLHWALSSEDIGIMKALLERGSPPDVRSDEGATPLMNAVQNAAMDRVTLLLDHGADVDAKDHRGFTALHRAAEMGLLEILQTLLARGAAPNPVAEGHTPRSLAEGRNRVDIIAILDSYIAGAQ